MTLEQYMTREAETGIPVTARVRRRGEEGVKPLAIDLFCGIGGFTEGLLAEGWDVIGFDIERHEAREQKFYEDYLKAEGLPRHWCGTCSPSV